MLPTHLQNTLKIPSTYSQHTPNKALINPQHTKHTLNKTPINPQSTLNLPQTNLQHTLIKNIPQTFHNRATDHQPSSAPWPCTFPLFNVGIYQVPDLLLKEEQKSFGVANFSHLSPRYNFISTPAQFGALDLWSGKLKITYTVSQELHQPKPFGTQDFISCILLIHTYT